MLCQPRVHCSELPCDGGPVEEEEEVEGPQGRVVRVRGDQGDGGGGKEAEGDGELEHQLGRAEEGDGDGQAAANHEPAIVGL